MAYLRTWSRTPGGRERVQLNISVAPGFKARVEALAEKMKGQLSIGGTLERAVELLELAAEGTPAPWEGVFYSKDPTHEEKLQILFDRGVLGKDPKEL